MLFTLSGLSNLTDGDGVYVLTFMTEHEPHLWLNEVIAIGEGSADVAAGALSMRYYSCHVGYRPDLTGNGNETPTGNRGDAKALAEIWNAEATQHALDAVTSGKL